MTDLLDYCVTERQREVMRALAECGSERAAARKLGVHHSTVHGIKRAVVSRAAQHGYAPDHDLTYPQAPGFRVKGVSTLYDEAGNRRLQWVKTTADDAAREEMVRQFVEALAEDVRGLADPVVSPDDTTDDLLSVYPMGDPHFGMLALAEEAGENFDIRIAERITKAAVDRLVAASPRSKTALLLNLGDFLHADDSTAQTPTSGHKLDVDTRHAKVMTISVKTLTYCIRRLLERHERVIVWMLPGNHDPHSSFALALCLSAFFEREPRVDVDLSPSHYRYMRWGKVLIGATHGDGAKQNNLPLVMASDRSRDWGLTQYRYWYCGHVHHKSAKEHPGVIVETFRTLAAKDAWHAKMGYRAGRDMQCIVHHKDYGEIERHRCDIAMVAS